MPTYVYAVVKPDGSLGPEFEYIQPLSATPLTVHPETGEPVRKIITSPSILSHTSGLLSNENLAKKGFTKYVKNGDGTYKKTAGEGPNSISA
jgi:predicted nucleic acid-binding Zn ribbon protein